MRQLLAALVAGLLVAGAALADIPPPPPPKGKKYVDVSHEVVLGKDVSGYVFVQQVGTGPGRPTYTHSKIELPAGKAVAMPAGGRRTYVTLFAVPQDAAKEFKADADLFEALAANKVKGAHRIGFAGTATVADTVKDKAVKWTHTITAVDKDGVKQKIEGEGYEVPAEKKDKPPVLAGSWVAGVAAALALVLGGLWVAGRSRRKV